MESRPKCHSSDQRPSRQWIPLREILHRNCGKSNHVLEHLLYTRHCARHHAHVTSLQAQNNPRSELSLCSLSRARPKWYQRIQTPDPGDMLPATADVCTLLPVGPAWPRLGAAVGRAISFSSCSVTAQGVGQSRQRAAQSARAQVGNSGCFFILLRSPPIGEATEKRVRKGLEKQWSLATAGSHYHPQASVCDMWGWQGRKGIPKKVAGWRRPLAGPAAFSAQMKPTCRPQPSRRERGHKQPSPLSSQSPRGGLDPPLAKLYQKSKAKMALDASRGTEQVDEGGKRTQRSQQEMSSLLAVSLPCRRVCSHQGEETGPVTLCRGVEGATLARRCHPQPRCEARASSQASALYNYIRPHAWKGPTLSLMLCWHHFEILNNFF